MKCEGLGNTWPGNGQDVFILPQLVVLLCVSMLYVFMRCVCVYAFVCMHAFEFRPAHAIMGSSVCASVGV